MKSVLVAPWRVSGGQGGGAVWRGRSVWGVALNKEGVGGGGLLVVLHGVVWCGAVRCGVVW